MWRCGSCGVVYSDPQPTGRVREKYLHEYDLAAHFATAARRKQALFERRLRRLPGPRRWGSRLCDVGCGDGLFMELAARRGWQVVGIEPNPPAVERARSRGLEVIEGLIEELPDLPGNDFEVVTAWDALEHTPEPRRFTSKLALLVAPGGLVAASTLNHRSAVAAISGLVGPW